MSKPIIGITLDFSEGGGFSPRPYYAIRNSYFDRVKEAGGVPIAIPYQPELIDEYLEMIDGLIIPGGDFALDADWYEGADGPAFPNSPRLEFDIAIIKKALSRNIPLLGICAGMQILAGMHDCKLTSNVQKYSKTNLNHLDEIEAESIAHQMIVSRGTLLHSIVKTDEFGVNSRHREGVVEVSDQVKVCGISDDDIIEAIELPKYKFAIGVQWHPEFFYNGENAEIINALVKTSSDML